MIDNGYWESDIFTDGIKIVSAGHIFANKGRKIERPAGRRDWLLFYVASGSESFFINGVKSVAETGSLILFKPGEPQLHVCEHTGVSEFYYVHFEFENESFSDFVTLSTSKVYKTSSGGTLSESFQRIISELQFGREFYREICVNHFKALIYAVKRKLYEDSGETESFKQKQIRKIIHEINRTWSNPLTLDDYADKFSLSKYYLSRLFKAQTGLSLIAYRNKIRLRHAEEMLSDSDEPVSAVASECGFETSQYFCDAFKKEYGISPSDYRKNKL